MKQREPVETTKPEEIIEESETYHDVNILKIMRYKNKQSDETKGQYKQRET